MDEPEEITTESAQKLIRMAEELLVTRQALEHALSTDESNELHGAQAALQSVVLLSDQVNEALKRWLEQDIPSDGAPH